MLISTAKGAKDDNRKNNRRGRNRDTKPRTICGMFRHHDRCKHASVRWLAPTRGARNPATACSSRNNSSSWHWISNPENGHSRWLSCAPLTRHRRRSRPNFHSRSRSLAHHPPPLSPPQPNHIRLRCDARHPTTPHSRDETEPASDVTRRFQDGLRLRTPPGYSYTAQRPKPIALTSPLHTTPFTSCHVNRSNRILDMTAAEDIATPELVRQLHTIPFTLRATVANGDTVPTVSMISAKTRHGSIWWHGLPGFPKNLTAFIPAPERQRIYTFVLSPTGKTFFVILPNTRAFNLPRT